jgi:protein-S-isoprenylcysteine O-methyltransferase Ste14
MRRMQTQRIQRETEAEGTNTMIILGLILLVLGYLLPMPILITIGWVLAGIGVILLLITTIGHKQIGSRRYWF